MNERKPTAEDIVAEAPALARQLLDMLNGRLGLFHIILEDSNGGQGIVVISNEAAGAQALYELARKYAGERSEFTVEFPPKGGAR